MNRVKNLIIVILLMLVCVSVFGANSVTTAVQSYIHQTVKLDEPSLGMRIYQMDWAASPIAFYSASDGVLASTGYVALESVTELRMETARIDGWVQKVSTIPKNATPSVNDAQYIVGATPTALYDLRLVDKDGVDIAEGGLSNRSASACEAVSFGATATYVNGTLYVDIQNNSAVAAKGVIRIYVWDEK